MLRLLVSAGGTGGGVYPALAVLEELREPAEILWVGGEGGMEATLVERARIQFRAIPAAGVHGVGWRAFPRNLWKLVRGALAAKRILREFKPNVLFFTGGYLAMPVAMAGWGVPKVIFVPDIEPGLAMKALSKWANRIAVPAEASRAYYRDLSKVEVTGYPTRRGLHRIDRQKARDRLGLHAQKPVLLVFGGSRGARSINHALWEHLDRLLLKMQVLHITGTLDWPHIEPVRSGISKELAADYHPYAYLHEEMACAFASADLALCRAGAATLGELPLYGLPAILVPYPHAWRYQKVNADYLTQNGAAIQVQDGKLGEMLSSSVMEVMEDPERLRSMREASRGLSKPAAAAAIAREIERFAPEEEWRDG